MLNPKSLLVAALALAACGAHAVPTYTYTATTVQSGTVTLAPTFYQSHKATVETTSALYQYLQPKNTTGSYLNVSNWGKNFSTVDPGYASVSAHNSSTFSFIWGSPDGYNMIDIYGSGGGYATYTGYDLAKDFKFQADGSNDNTRWLTITAAQGQTIDHVTFRSQGIAFEVAVPEPEGYALMLAGLGTFGVIVRRRKQTFEPNQVH